MAYTLLPGDKVLREGRWYRINDRGDMEQIPLGMQNEDRIRTHAPEKIWVQWCPMSGVLVQERKFAIQSGIIGVYERVWPEVGKS